MITLINIGLVAAAKLKWGKKPLTTMNVMDTTLLVVTIEGVVFIYTVLIRLFL